MLSIALKGLPAAALGRSQPKIDQFRKQLETEHIDILLLHCLRPPRKESWPRRLGSRMNHDGATMDTPERREPDLAGSVNEVVGHTKKAPRRVWV